MHLLMVVVWLIVRHLELLLLADRHTVSDLRTSQARKLRNLVGIVQVTVCRHLGLLLLLLHCSLLVLDLLDQSLLVHELRQSFLLVDKLKCELGVFLARVNQLKDLVDRHFESEWSE